jgi:HK97 family phage prohead protease
MIETRDATDTPTKPQIIVSDVDDTILRNGIEPIDKTISFLNESDIAVVILTGRAEAARDDTAAALDAVGLEYAMLLTNNTSAETLAYKRDTMQSLLNQFDVVLAVDNDADVRAAYTDLGVEAVDPTNLPDTVRADAGFYVPDMPGIEQKALPMDPDQMIEDALEAAEGPETLCQLLAEQLSDVVAFKFIAHGYHWNVKGSQFTEYHSLFGMIYEDADDSIDPLAENILKLGYDAPFRLSDFQQLRELDEPALTPDTPAAMAASLLDLNDDIIDGYNEAYAQSQVENQQGVANFLAERIDAHQKWAWQLRSSIGAQQQVLMEPVANPIPTNTGDTTESVDMTGMTDQVDPMGMAPYAPDQKIRKITRPVEYSAPATRANVTETGVEQRIVMDSQITFRAMTDAEDAGGMSFYGYAAAFNSPSEPLPFTETIAPGAFSRTLKARNEVKMLMNHDTGRVLASRRAGTLRLSEDSYGLRVEADLPDTTDGRDLSVLLKRGDITSMSFGFTVPEGGDYWSDENNRELRDVRLHEISVVAFPAYQASAAGVRSIDMLADKTGLDADMLAEAMTALERGEKLTDEQAAVLEESVAKLRDHKPEPTASISELQAQLKAKMHVAA